MSLEKSLQRLLLPAVLLLSVGQLSYRAEIRGVVTDSTGAVLTNAGVGMKLEVHAEFFNFFNTARFAFPDVAYGDSTFGVISTTAQGSTPRQGQFGVRFEF